jgi:hypothetical protein
MEKTLSINDDNGNNCNNNKKGIVLLFIISSVLIVSILCFSSTVYAQVPSFSPSSAPSNVSGTDNVSRTDNGSSIAQGSIASLQNNQSGQQTWLLTGRWNMTKSTTDLPLFRALITMTKLDGTMKHRHTISTKDTSNGTMTGNSTSANNTFNGTATVSLDKGSIAKDVPISVKITRSIMSLWIDPSKVSNHFGNTPIYGSAR